MGEEQNEAKKSKKCSKEKGKKRTKKVARIVHGSGTQTKRDSVRVPDNFGSVFLVTQ